ncbi:MAG: serine/threonine-protein kinase [Planctomycetota bacterium]|nr:serine/threonine-protein kinase [Planctomycetota bacterium]
MNRPHQAATTPRGRAAPGQLVRTIGPWQLVRLLGEGAWTEVYRARPASSTREETADYVVKVLKPSCQNDPLAIQLLQREVFVARQVRHPHLSSILSAHTDHAPRFVVMPNIDGISAADALTEAGRFIVPQGLWIVRQTAEGLQALHQHGWLHGDVKPANIIVSANGHATLVDLGLARALDASRSSDEPLTGSMAYACPEAFNPHVPFGPGSDVYSLGITLYELLTASRPFNDQDPTDLAAAHLTRLIPDPRLLVPQLPPRVSRLLRHMLAKDPLRRPAVPELIDWLVDLEVATFSERWAA